MSQNDEKFTTANSPFKILHGSRVMEIRYAIGVIIGVLLYKSIKHLLTRTKSKEAELYHSLIFDGCQHCGGELGIVLTPPSQYTRLDCTDCGAEYNVDHSLQHGWRIK